MIASDIAHLVDEAAVDAMAAAAGYLDKAVRNPPADGRVEIDGNRVYALVQSYNTRTGKENPRFEVHRRYIDVQFMLEGFELCGWAPAERMSINVPYDETKDIAFGRVSADDIVLVPFPSGRALVFHPWDAHAPCLAVTEPSPVRKIVVKIAV
jgi:YhcH/YjgK/YiaL family protein